MQRWVVYVATQLISQICHWITLVAWLLHVVYHGLFLLLFCANNVQGRNAPPLYSEKETFTIHRRLCHAGPRVKHTELNLQSWSDDVAQLIHVWWFPTQITLSIHFSPLVHSKSSLTTSYTSGTEVAIALGRMVGASSYASVAVDLICLLQVSLACCNSELEGLNYTGVISHMST